MNGDYGHNRISIVEGWVGGTLDKNSRSGDCYSIC